jgi:hypothetical protein
LGFPFPPPLAHIKVGSASLRVGQDQLNASEREERERRAGKRRQQICTADTRVDRYKL